MPAPVSSYVRQHPTPCEARRRARAACAAWCAVAAAALGSAGLIVLAPLALARVQAAGALGLYGGFAVVCHQIPERSFELAGFPLAVCARCAGLYAGFAAGVLLYPLARPLGRAAAPARGWILAAALPTAVDFALGVTGVWANTHLTRFSTACLLGACASLYVVPGAAELAMAARRRSAAAGAARSL